MTQIEETTLSDWPSLIKMGNHLDVVRGFERSYIFRGHADARWRLLSTLHRAATNSGERELPKVSSLLKLEESLVASFREQAPNFMAPATLQATHAHFDWWTVMRHYGAPTRLIDWTMSLYVAAYFACSAEPAVDGVIYVLHLESLERAMQGAFGDTVAFNARTAEKLYRSADAPAALHVVGRSTALLDRMVAQQGCFLASMNVATDVEDCLASRVSAAQAEKIISVLKLRVPAKAKPDIVHRLRAMNVSAATLFPGLDGIGRLLDDIVRFP